MKRLVVFGVFLTLSFTQAIAQDKIGAQEIAKQKTEKMAKVLQLSAEQKESVLQINLREAQQQSQPMTAEEKQTSDRNFEERFRMVLTADQFVQYKEMKQINAR